VFRQDLAATLAFRRKRAGQLGSKMRFFSAQMEAYLTDDLWLSNARHSNAMAKALAVGLRGIAGVKIGDVPQENILFCELPMEMIRGLLAQRFKFYHERWDSGVVRFVTSVATSQTDIDDILQAAWSLAI